MDYANSTHLDFTECHLGKIKKEGILHELTFPMLTEDTGQVFFLIYKTAYYIEIWF